MKSVIVSFYACVLMLVGVSCNNADPRNDFFQHYRSTVWDTVQSPVVLSPVTLRDTLEVYLKTDRFQEAIDRCSEAIRPAIVTNDIELQAFIHYCLGMSMVQVEAYDDGAIHLEQARLLLSDVHDPVRMKAYSRYVRGDARHKYQLMMYAESAQLYEHSLEVVMAAYKNDPFVFTAIEYDSICGDIFNYLARCQYGIGNGEEGDKWYARFKESNFASTDLGRYREMEILFMSDRFQDAYNMMKTIEPIFDPCMSLSGDSKYCGININIVRFRKFKTWVYSYLGMWHEAAIAWKQYEEARHFWTKKTYHNQIAHKYEEFDIAYKQGRWEVEYNNSQMRLWLIVLLVVLLFVSLAASAIHFYYYRLVKTKNQALAENVNLIIDRRMEEQRLVQNSCVTLKGERKEAILDFIRLLDERKLYCNPDFSRDDLIAELNLNKSTFVKDFEQATGENYLQYLQRIRLDYAASLIRMNWNNKIEDIAQESGFTSRSTFYRLFQKQFKISPVEYRKQCGTLSS